MKIFILLAFFSHLVFSQGTRIFIPTPGANQAKDLPENFTSSVDSILFDINDAFEGSKINSTAEENVYALGNKLHIESKKSTIQKRLLFKRGDLINRDLLLETEKAIRKQEYIADAIIEVLELEEGKSLVIIHTFDQWTTVPAASLQRLGNEWVYWGGLIESNVLGTGQKVGVVYTHNTERNSLVTLYQNNDFIVPNLNLNSNYAWSDDGYSYLFELERPFLSRTQNWLYKFGTSGIKSTKYFYTDADEPGEAARRDSLRKDRTCLFFFTCIDPGSGLFLQYNDVVDLQFESIITRSFGRKHKINISGMFTWSERYQDNGLTYLGLAYDTTRFSKTRIPDPFRLDFRNDYLLGIRLSYYQNDYKTVKNFRNLKWNEDLDVGFRLSTNVLQNIEAFGAKNSDLLLRHEFVYINAWQSQYFLTNNLNTAYYLGYDGKLEDGIVNHILETQWKPLPNHSTYFSSIWNNYFAKEKSGQLVLGEEMGLNGYPNRYFSGQARLLMNLEQRYFPNLEFGTAVPALAVFLNAGDAFPSYSDFDWNKLHYSAGAGLRIGASRSTQKVVNHINFSVPLDPKYRDILSWTFSIRAKASL